MIDDDFMSFDDVEERLIEAFVSLAALPDRERGWLSTRTMGLWREVMPERVDVDAEPTPARPGVSRSQYQRMEEALGWCQWVEPAARRLIGRVMLHLASDREPHWPAIRRNLRDARTTDALRKAYSRSITRICNKLNHSRGAHFHLSR